MQSITSQLCGRCLDVCDDRVGCVAMGCLERGQRAVIAGYTDETDMTISRRLFDLGFAQGVEVELVRRAPMRDPLMFRVGGAEMLLRRGEADRIMVRVG